MSTVLDFSAQPWPKYLGEHLGVLRYIGRPGHDKNLTYAELKWRMEHKQPVALVFEFTEGRALLGHDAGREDAWSVVGDWQTNLLQSLGDLPLVYGAVDKDVSASDLPAIDEYLRGMGEVLHPSRVGVYGEYIVVEHCVGVSKRARLGWQTRAWSGTGVSAFASLYQTSEQVEVSGITCDLNRVVTHTDWGQFTGPSTKPGGVTEVANTPAELSSGAFTGFKKGVTERYDKNAATVREMLAAWPHLVKAVNDLTDEVRALAARQSTVTPHAHGPVTGAVLPPAE